MLNNEKQEMKIVYLYAELMPYQLIIFDELVNTYGATIIAIHWDKKKLTPYSLREIKNVTYASYSNFKSKSEMLEFVKIQTPDIIYCSGWMDKYYNYIAKHMSKSIPVVAGSDTQWKGGKQWIHVLLSQFKHKRWFTHLWVSGTYQFEYARKLGFEKKKILFNSLSADVLLYSKFGKANIKSKAKKFVYIGRLRDVKGTDLLAQAYTIFKERTNSEWGLTCIGNGPMKPLLEKSGIEVIDFMSQEDICAMSNTFGAFVLPSRREPWGVVLHEATCLGLPIIASNICGGNSTFLIDGYNGYSFQSNEVEDLVRKMILISDKSDEELQMMRENSFALSTRITPEITAASLLSARR